MIPFEEPSSNKDLDYDPVFLHSRREALIIFCLWLTALLWAVPFCYFNEFGRPVDPETFSTVLGIPTWLFWGIVVPWLLADIFTIWFCFFYMKDDDLGEVHEGGDLEEEIAELHTKERTAEEGEA